MADVEAAKEGGAAEAGKDKAEEESSAKLCFFACLDCIATIARWCVAAWNGFRWVARRVAYPFKEMIFACIDGWSRWYKPFKRKTPQATNVPSFGYGHNVPDFQY
mmetsp:Transcript_28379/g.90317  ORF Transcript_28379/g.90317 Transcript_28379/m.90317 type:complete len:105 (+) Transcript_28379:140-454(+)